MTFRRRTGPGIVRACGCPRTVCYYAPLRCRGRWVGVRVEATDHARRDLAGCTLLLEASLREGEPTPRVETTKTRKRTDVDDDEGGAPEREENELAAADPAGDQPAEEPARKRRRIRRKASAEAAVGRREANDALPRRAARAKPHSPDPEDVVGRSIVKKIVGRRGRLCRHRRIVGPQAQALPRGVRRRRRGGSGSARVAVVPHAGARRMRRSFAARWIRIESNGIVHRSSLAARPTLALPPLSREFSPSRVFPTSSTTL